MPTGSLKRSSAMLMSSVDQYWTTRTSSGSRGCTTVLGGLVKTGRCMNSGGEVHLNVHRGQGLHAADDSWILCTNFGSCLRSSFKHRAKLPGRLASACFRCAGLKGFACSSPHVSWVGTTGPNGQFCRGAHWLRLSPQRVTGAPWMARRAATFLGSLGA